MEVFFRLSLGFLESTASSKLRRQNTFFFLAAWALTANDLTAIGTATTDTITARFQTIATRAYIFFGLGAAHWTAALMASQRVAIDAAHVASKVKIEAHTRANCAQRAKCSTARQQTASTALQVSFSIIFVHSRLTRLLPRTAAYSTRAETCQ